MHFIKCSISHHTLCHVAGDIRHMVPNALKAVYQIIQNHTAVHTAVTVLKTFHMMGLDYFFQRIYRL